MKWMALAAAIFLLTAPAAAHGYRILYAFCSQANCADGDEPNSLVSDASRNLYGTAYHGGANDAGAIFELKRGGNGYTFTLVYSFCQLADCADGGYPPPGLVRDTSGNLYGTTLLGGTGGYSGEVFELLRGRKNWSLKILHSFCSQGTNCADGSAPQAGLAYAAQQSGALYDGTSPLFGTTVNGGTNGVYGVAYELAPGRSGWTYQVLYNFCSLANCADGANPTAALVQDAAGNLFGTTAGGGVPQDVGTVFELANAGGSWAENVLYTFCSLPGCTDGADPEAGLVLDSQSNLDGTTLEGGVSCRVGLAEGCGVAFTLAPSGTETVQHTFCVRLKCADGAGPVGTATPDANGDLFAIAEFGGDFGIGSYGGGTLYELAGSRFTLLHKFCARPACSDGGEPGSAPIRDASGHLLGTAAVGGAHNGGVVYEYVP